MSPLKIKQVTGGTSVHPPVLSGTTSSLGPNVKVVKLSSVSAAMAEAAAAGQQTTTLQIANSAQVLTPSKQQPGGGLNLLAAASSPASSASASAVLLESLSSSGNRKRSDIDFDAFSDAKRRKSEKGGKGLRHFSMKVCEKVQAKGSTSYNEVADELVSELTDPRCTSPTDQQYDQKNIRRQVKSCKYPRFKGPKRAVCL